VTNTAGQTISITKEDKEIFELNAPLKTKYNRTGDAIDMTALENEWNEVKMSKRHYYGTQDLQ
jgi:hypothetical protein